MAVDSPLLGLCSSKKNLRLLWAWNSCIPSVLHGFLNLRPANILLPCSLRSRLVLLSLIITLIVKKIWLPGWLGLLPRLLLSLLLLLIILRNLVSLMPIIWLLSLFCPFTILSCNLFLILKVFWLSLCFTLRALSLKCTLLRCLSSRRNGSSRERLLIHEEKRLLDLLRLLLGYGMSKAESRVGLCSLVPRHLFIFQ